MTIILYFCRTCEALALFEVHTLHAVGEHDLVDSTLRVGRQGEGNDKVRNEETRAADRNLFNLIPYSQLTLEAIAVGEVHVLHALGEHDLVDSTCGREGEEREKDK